MKTNLKIFFLISMLLVLARCSGADLTAQANQNPGVFGGLHLSFIQHGEAGAILPNPAGEKEFDTDLGYHIRLQDARIYWHRIELISSGADPECLGGNDQSLALNRLQDFLGEDGMADDLLETQIPLVSYCQFKLSFAPSEHAAIKHHDGEDHGSDTAAEGYHLKGVWSKGPDSGDFHIESLGETVVSGEFTHPLHFHEGESEVAVTFEVHYDELLNGIEFSALPAEAAQQAAFEENLREAIHYEVGSGHGH